MCRCRYISWAHKSSVLWFLGPHCPHQPFQDLVVTPVVQGRQVGFGAESIRAFADCLWEGKAPAVTGIDGLRATEILVAAVESAETGRPVQVRRHEP